MRMNEIVEAARSALPLAHYEAGLSRRGWIKVS